METLEVQCEFSDSKLEATGEVTYSCYVVDKLLDDVKPLKFIGRHKTGRTNYYVTALYIRNCRNITKVPSGLIEEFPNLKILIVSYCNLRKVENDDLKDLKTLQALCLEGNHIDFLPANLFDGLEHLERISFFNNRIKLVDPQFSTGIPHLKYLNLRENIFINKCFDLISDDGNATLEELINEIRNKCVNNWRFYYEMLEVKVEALKDENLRLKRGQDAANKEIDSLINQLIKEKDENEAVKRENDTLKEENENLKQENEKLKEENEKLKEKFEENSNCNKNGENSSNSPSGLYLSSSSSSSIDKPSDFSFKSSEYDSKSLECESKPSNFTSNPFKDQKYPSLLFDLKSHVQNPSFKDFTITVDSQEFRVHKFLLAARSPILAKMILDSPDALNLNLVDISIATFKEILNFIYNDDYPPLDVNFKDIFIAAGRMGICELINYSGDMLIDAVNIENAHEMLILSNKYEHNDLRRKSFNELKKLFPDKELKDDLAFQPEKIKKLFECKRKYEETMKKLAVEFEKVWEEFD